MTEFKRRPDSAGRWRVFDDTTSGEVTTNALAPRTLLSMADVLCCLASAVVQASRSER